MLETSFYSEEELPSLGLGAYGEDVRISRFCRIYSAEHVFLGSHVRIDDFCLISGHVTIGSYVHISAYAGVFAGEYGVDIEDFTALSSKVTVYAINEDYSGESLTNPMIPSEMRNLQGGRVTIKKHAIIGSGCIVLPNVTIGTGAAIGALSLIPRDVPEWTICGGVPARVIKPRSRALLDKERAMRGDPNA